MTNRKLNVLPNIVENQLPTQITSGFDLATPDLEQVKNYALEFENVSRGYRLYHEPHLTLQDRVINLFKHKHSHEEFWALKDISFKLERGRTLGIIGQNGAGKSTMLKLATRILEPSSGVIRVNGRVSAMLELGTGFHPELTARDNIYLNGAFYGYNRQQMDERYERIVEFSELSKFIDTPVKHFSSGMYMRLGFAVAITVDPDILIIDEVLAVGDAAFGRKCHRAIDDLKQKGKTMLFVSHAAGEISRFCDEVIYLSKGQIVACGKPGDVLDEYMMNSMGPSYYTSELVAKTSPALVEPQPKTSPALAEPRAKTNPALAKPQTSTSKPVDSVGDAALSKGKIESKAVLPGDKLFSTEWLNQQYSQVSVGITQPQNNWQFSLSDTSGDTSKRTNSSDEVVEYYLAILNPELWTVQCELVGYKRAGSLFDQVAGALRVIPMLQFELASHELKIIKLEDGALIRTSLLQLKASHGVAAEWLEFRPVVRKNSLPAAKLPKAMPRFGMELGQLHYFPFCDIRANNLCRFEVFNPNEQPLEVYFSLYRDWAEPVHRLQTFECAPHSQLSLDLNQELAGGEGERQPGERFYGSILIEASAPVIVERYSLQLTSPHYHLFDS
jgi:ABC-type polysaccharide/polyol phosphate transport system ATPase subunit